MRCVPPCLIIKTSYFLTPWNVRVSPKHVTTVLYDSDSVVLSITATVKLSGIEAMQGSTPA